MVYAYRSYWCYVNCMQPTCKATPECTQVQQGQRRHLHALRGHGLHALDHVPVEREAAAVGAPQRLL
jgi:hypothetical protein